MDLKNQNGANVQGNGSAKEGLNNTAKNNEAKKGATPAAGGAEKPNGKAEAVKQEPAKPDTKAEPEKVSPVQAVPVALPQPPQDAAKPVKLVP